MHKIQFDLPHGKKIFFASDFHLGIPDASSSRDREKKIVSWLDEIKSETGALFLVGDLFDFWFEYQHVVPKGNVRLLGKLAELSDSGIPIYIFKGNHDLWLSKYLTQEFDAIIFENPILLECNNRTFYVGHGDGLGPGDTFYKLLKVVFTNHFARWCFSLLHPTISFGLARKWSADSRLKSKADDEEFKGDNERLLIFCKSVVEKISVNYFIFGHRHMPLEMTVNGDSKYFNLGEWVENPTYAVYDGKTLHLKQYHA